MGRPLVRGCDGYHLNGSVEMEKYMDSRHVWGIKSTELEDELNTVGM
jgi:hypothetical protein